MATANDTSFGQALFKWRSFTPVPVIAVLGALLYRSRGAPGPGGADVDAALNVIGVLVALVGQALRAWVLGQVPEGTSGQGNALEASTLNRTGPYARVRNPLYVGNALICIGLLLIAWDPLVAVLALAFFFGQYFFIIRAEEAFLRGRFGAAFDDFCATVPRWIPRLTPVTDVALSHRFDWRRALRKEHNPFAAWASGAIGLFAWELAARQPAHFQQLWPVLLASEIVLLVAFVGVKGWKHQWWRKSKH